MEYKASCYCALTIELQITPYYLGMVAGEGFIFGSSVCYSPGYEEWVNLMEKYFNK